MLVQNSYTTAFKSVGFIKPEKVNNTNNIFILFILNNTLRLNNTLWKENGKASEMFCTS